MRKLRSRAKMRNLRSLDHPSNPGSARDAPLRRSSVAKRISLLERNYATCNCGAVIRASNDENYACEKSMQGHRKARTVGKSTVLRTKRTTPADQCISDETCAAHNAAVTALHLCCMHPSAGVDRLRWCQPERAHAAFPCTRKWLQKSARS